jgi:hypothetical protein
MHSLSTQFAMFLADHEPTMPIRQQGHSFASVYGHGRVSITAKNIGRTRAYVFLTCALKPARARIKNLLRFRRMPKGNGNWFLPPTLVWSPKDRTMVEADLTPERRQSPPASTKTMDAGQRHPSAKSERLIGKARLYAIRNPSMCSHRVKDEQDGMCNCRDCGKPIHRRKRY